MTEIETQQHYFDDVEEVVADELRFKFKLGIGSDAFASLKYGKKAQELWDVGGVAATGAGIAASTTVASTFFASGGWLSAIGLGAAAVTPVGWIIAAGAFSGGAYYGVTRVMRGYSANRVAEIPQFINTPIDVLGANLVDLIAPLALRIALIDGHLDPREIDVIEAYFVKEWGVSPEYIGPALKLIGENADEKAIKSIAKQIAKFVKTNPDCNFQHITKDIIAFLWEIAGADDRVDDREELAIEKIESIFSEEGRLSLGSIWPFS